MSSIQASTPIVAMVRFYRIVYRAICKTIFSPKLCVMLEILSSEYQSYACGKISRMP